jgi:hypothetical protein
MPRHASWRVVIVAALSAPACAVHMAPPGWLPRVKELPSWSRGAWIEVARVRGAGPRVMGELIAVGDGELHVLSEDGLRAVPASQVASASLMLYASDDIGGLGLLWSLTHGRFLIFTMIPWMAIASGESYAPRLHHPPWALPAFRPYSRFPQGLPPGLDAKDLGPLRRGR